MDDDGRLGAFLKNRRARLDPAAFGLSGRRRTPGLRREEVAQRAGISTTWYTWLEQGRGGAPSAQTLDRVAEALLLTEAEREHLFLVGIGRPPKARSGARDGITPRLQRFLDSMAFIPAIVATPHWDIIAWNEAARRTLTDYPSLAPEERNILRRIFLDPRTRAAQEDWESIARFLVATFRAETTRLGEDERSRALIAELSDSGTEFLAMWTDNEVRATGEGIKMMKHPVAGRVALEFSSFAVDGRSDLKLVIYNPARSEDEAAIRRLCETERQ